MLYNLRGILQRILLRPEYKVEDFPAADNALRQLENVGVDLELFKVFNR